MSTLINRQLEKLSNNKIFLKLKEASPLIVGASAVLVILIIPLTTSAHQQAQTKKTSYKKVSTSKPAKKTTTPTKTVAKPVTTAPATAPTPTATHTTTPVANVVPTPVNVVVPAPSSSVSGLTPVAPPSQPSGSQSGSGSSSGQSSGDTPPTYTPTIYDSTNWSGYMSPSGSYTAISGSWVAPSATGNGFSTSADATWIGIGGVTTNDLIQVGTDNIVSASGQVTTSAFYEMLPSAETTIPSITVNPGDSISASLVENSGSQWAVTITDNTDSQTFTTNVAYASTNSSAEWIEEDPSYSNHHLIPLDNFSDVVFSNSTTVDNGSTVSISGSSADEIILVNGSDAPVATPSSLVGSGRGFSVSED